MEDYQIQRNENPDELRAVFANWIEPNRKNCGVGRSCPKNRPKLSTLSLSAHNRTEDKTQNEKFIKSDKQNKEKIQGFCEMGKIRKAQNRFEIRELGSELKEVQKQQEIRLKKKR